MQPLSPAPIQAPISMLEKTPALLEVLLRSLSAEELEWKPGAERWSIAEVLEPYADRSRDCTSRGRGESCWKILRICRRTRHLEEGDTKEISAATSMEEFVPLRRAFVFYLHSVPSACRGARWPARRTRQRFRFRRCCTNWRITISVICGRLPNSYPAHTVSIRMPDHFKNIPIQNHEHSFGRRAPGCTSPRGYCLLASGMSSLRRGQNSVAATAD